jgi:nucleoside-diphosphate-sugar epimerase
VAQIRKHPEIDTILFIGPNGNLGQALIPELLALGYRVRALQFRSEVTPREGLEIVHGHTLDRDAVARAVEGVDAICHMIRPIRGIGDTAAERWFNGCVVGTKNLLEAARAHGVARFINGSADNVFGHTTVPHYGPIDETHPKRFADEYYGLFKIVEEAMLEQYAVGFDIPVVITRFGWVWTGVFAETGAYALDRERKQVRLRLDREGKPLVRHDVHIDDAVQGVLLSLSTDAAVGEDFLFVGPAPYSSERLAEILQAHTGWPIVEVETDWHSWTSSSGKAQAVLGYQPQVELMSWLAGRLSEGAADA